jgi:hypothetical protein
MPSSHIQPAIASTALWRPTSSTNVRISAPLASAQPWHRARLLVDRFVHAHGVEQPEERFLVDAQPVVEADRLDVGHEVAEHRALAAAGGRRALLGLLLEVVQAVARGDRDGIHVPVDLHRHDLVDGGHEALVAQEADGERLGRGAQRHQRDDFLLVDVEGEGMLAGYGRGHYVAQLVARIDRVGRGTGVLREDRSVAHGVSRR